MRLSLGLFFVAAAFVAACGATDTLGQGEDDVATGMRTVMPNRVAEDSDLRGGETITAGDVQEFLVKQKSALANYQEGGRKAAEMIVDESRKENVSPVYILARLETEQGLISSGKLNGLKSATGCGCPDTAACDPAHANFGPQIRCAAATVTRYYAQLEKGATVSNWQVGVAKQTSDGCTVTPANKATAALYTYTPWVGAYGTNCGTTRWGGSSLVGRLIAAYRPSFGGAASDVPREDEKDTGNNEADAGSLGASDAGTRDAASTPPQSDPEPSTPSTEEDTTLPDDVEKPLETTPDEYENPPEQPGKPRSGKRSVGATSQLPYAGDGVEYTNSGCSTGSGAAASWLPVGLAAMLLALKRRRSK